MCGVDAVGAGPVQTEDVLQGGLPVLAAEVPLRATDIPPERLPVGHRLPLAARRGEGLATRRHHQAGTLSYSLTSYNTPSTPGATFTVPC